MFDQEIQSLNVQIDNCYERIQGLLASIKKAKEDEVWYIIEEYENGTFTSDELCRDLLSACTSVEDFAYVAQLSVAMLEKANAVTARNEYQRIAKKKALKALVNQL